MTINDETDYLCKLAFKKFYKISIAHVLFHVIFIVLLSTEILTTILTMPFLFKNIIFAFILAATLLTTFVYFSLKLYFQIKKPIQFRELCADYLATCNELLHCENNNNVQQQYHVFIANSAYKLAKYLYGKEYSFYKLYKLFSSLNIALEKFSCWLHWNDVFVMEELLLLHSVQQYIDLVKLEPTNLEIHASLANAYIVLSNLYIDPKKLQGFTNDKWIPQERFSEENKYKYKIAAERAIEEFTILNHYAPEDPWVHTQLAYSYHDLQMPEKEIAQYEKVLQLLPDNHETLFKLGILYFQQGENAQGLKVYEKFKNINPQRAESLIQFYGAYKIIEDILKKT